jgi:hypothetical protein
MYTFSLLQMVSARVAISRPLGIASLTGADKNLCVEYASERDEQQEKLEDGSRGTNRRSMISSFITKPSLSTILITSIIFIGLTYSVIKLFRYLL